MNRRELVAAAAAFIPFSASAYSYASAQEQTVPPDFVALGVQEDGRWVSPQFGVEIQWSEPYALDYTPGASIFSNEYGDQFNIFLGDARGLFNASISGPQNSVHVPFAEQEKTTKEFESNNDPTFLLFKATDEYVGALLVIEWGISGLTGENMPNQVFLHQAYPSKSNPEIVIDTRIDARYDHIEDFVRALDGQVTIEGESALHAFSLEEVLEALQNLPKDGAHVSETNF